MNLFVKSILTFIITIALIVLPACTTETAFRGPALKRLLERHSRIMLPPGKGPFPGVVLISGGGGIGHREKDWAERLTRWGYACLLVDSHSPRGFFHREVVGQGRKVLPGWERAVDVWWGYSRLSRHPKVDPRRIGVIGWSHGAWTVMEALRPDIAPPGVRFKAVVVFYPGCRGGRPKSLYGPMLMLLAGLDDWNPPGPCRQWAQGLKRRGAKIQVEFFPQARHAFDNPSIEAYRYIGRANFGRGALIGHSLSATRRARKIVKAFLAVNLR
ncbi:MAG: dienelactone hydrolase family protein [Proteobacteria bacterium]|nr:dienelactone hydrolase family protein [Pseudomonadota bacterium]MBU1741962.1 dienelactone hydrolase family protein [Pseudomonadota bacterium]